MTANSYSFCNPLVSTLQHPLYDNYVQWTSMHRRTTTLLFLSSWRTKWMKGTQVQGVRYWGLVVIFLSYHVQMKLICTFRYCRLSSVSFWLLRRTFKEQIGKHWQLHMRRVGVEPRPDLVQGFTRGGSSSSSNNQKDVNSFDADRSSGGDDREIEHSESGSPDSDEPIPTSTVLPIPC